MQKTELTRQNVGAIIFLIVGIGVGVIGLIMISSIGGQTYNLIEPDINTVSYRVDLNESFTARNDTWVQLDHYPMYSGAQVLNGTSFTDNTTNFNINVTTGNLILISENASLNGTTCYCVYGYYNYTIRDDIKASIRSSFTALKQTGSYMPLIVLAVIIVIILGIIIGIVGGSGDKFIGGQGSIQNKNGYYGGAL